MPSTFIDQTLLNQMQGHLVEPQDLGASWASGQWTFSEVVAYLNQQMQQLLKDTCAVVNFASTALTLPAGTFTQQGDWLITWYVSWGTSQFVGKRSLERGDRAEMDLLLLPATASRPRYYLEDDTPGTLIAAVAPVPAAAGHITQYYVQAGALLEGDGQTVSVPDILAMGVKWGAIAMQLSKVGRGADPERAALAWSRRQEIVEAARLLFLGFA